ncbi:XVIPCD domain-containing protein [Lysobacter brunescens]|uniref:XVIPCD domain-containing protein n=1 Tax=Lysobacter brunescens TaxID=262323 RepID=A0ABW2YA31_9GAMM
MGSHRVTLSNQQTVMLADWHDQRPTQHGDTLRDKPWDRSHDRNGLAFYESTVNLMRNEQAVALMPSVVFTHENKTYRLFMSEKTGTWHSPEALDIDHVKEWKKHLIDKKVTNYADANMAYNDTDNLRLLPSSYNRSRNKVDRLLEGGVDSDEWRAWLKENAEFDPNAPHREFDPQKDNARRKASTLNATWSPEDGRGDLYFDTRVKSIWLENELSKRYALTVDIPDAETGELAYSVPLFHCATTGQLVTRDAFDIDHRRPISDVLQEMCDNSDTGTISKAAALDAYNDVGNLQLVSRSANCSHEWERDALGRFDGDYDFGSEDDLADFIDDRDPQVVALEGQAFEDEVLATNDEQMPDEPAPSGVKRDNRDFDNRVTASWNPDDLSQDSDPPARKRITLGPPEPLPERPAQLNDAMHPQNRLYVDACVAMDRYDPTGQIFGHGKEREKIAAALTVEAHRSQLQRIDHVTASGRSIFATQGDLGAPTSLNARTTFIHATSRTLVEHTQAIDMLPQPPQPNVQQPPQVVSMQRY